MQAGKTGERMKRNVYRPLLFARSALWWLSQRWLGCRSWWSWCTKSWQTLACPWSSALCRKNVGKTWSSPKNYFLWIKNTFKWFKHCSVPILVAELYTTLDCRAPMTHCKLLSPTCSSSFGGLILPGSQLQFRNVRNNLKFISLELTSVFSNSSAVQPQRFSIQR